MEDDDIDDLLDEVEANFVKKKPIADCKQARNVNQINGTVSSKAPKRRSKDDELNSLMQEICDIPDPISTQRISTPKMSNSPSPADPKRRCFAVYLGGSSYPEGLTTTANQRACDKLRCTDCDFKVSVFRDFVWDSSADYLFLRNNMPEFARLKSKLTSKTGWKAYGCQCRCRNVSKFTELSKEKDLKWVCGKHS